MSNKDQLTVNSLPAMEQAIGFHAGRGFTVVSQAAEKAVLEKPKHFSIMLGVVGFLAGGVGLGIYAVWYALQPKSRVLEIILKRTDAQISADIARVARELPLDPQLKIR